MACYSTDRNGIITIALPCGAEVYDLTCYGDINAAVDKVVAMKRNAAGFAPTLLCDITDTGIYRKQR